MNRLVLYAETSSDEEDECASIKFSTSQKNAVSQLFVDKPDLGRHNVNIVSSDSELEIKPAESKSKCINFFTATFSSNDSESDEGGRELKAVSEYVCRSSSIATRHMENPETKTSSNDLLKRQPCYKELETCVQKSKTSNGKDYLSFADASSSSSDHCDQSSDTQVKDGDMKNQVSSSPYFHQTVARSVPRYEPLQKESAQTKRKISKDDESDAKKRLCVPSSIFSMYENQQHRWKDNPAEHDNRVRSFPHLEGNWATFVYIPVEQDQRFIKFVEDLLGLLRPLPFQALTDFHVSLSRTVTIRHHWIEPLVQSLRENLKHCKSCVSDMMSVRLFTNDDKARTFMCLELSQDDGDFLDYVKAVDKSFAEFKLPEYYKNPSFHISIGWCLGDVMKTVSQEQMNKAKENLGEFVATNPDLSVIFVQQICCQSGNKTFALTLQDSDK